MLIGFFFSTGKGHCFPSLTLSYKPVPPLSLKNSGSKFFNQLKCILMQYLLKLDILIEFFIYGGPLVSPLHTVQIRVNKAFQARVSIKSKRLIHESVTCV